MTDDTPIQPANVAAAWTRFFADFQGDFAVTFALHNRAAAPAGPCFQITNLGRVCITGGTPRSYPGFVRRISPEEIQCLVHRVHARIDRSLYGRRYHTLSTSERSAFVGMIEHPDENAHIHLVWRVPTGKHGNARVEFAHTLTHCWSSLQPGGSAVVRSLHDSAGWAAYAVKDQRQFLPWSYVYEDRAELFLASRAA